MRMLNIFSLVSLDNGPGEDINSQNCFWKDGNINFLFFSLTGSLPKTGYTQNLRGFFILREKQYCFVNRFRFWSQKRQ